MSDVAVAETGGKKPGVFGRVKKGRVGVRVDMTPMVDIAFLLLIFFMVTTVFRRPLAMEVNMPEADARVEVPESNVLEIKGDWKQYDRPHQAHPRIDCQHRCANQPSLDEGAKCPDQARHGCQCDAHLFMRGSGSEDEHHNATKGKSNPDHAWPMDSLSEEHNCHDQRKRHTKLPGNCERAHIV